MLALLRVLVIEPVGVVLGPFLFVFFLGALWPWLYLVVGGWLGWIAFVSGQNAYYVWRAIFRREPWRDAYYHSLFYQGASRARAYAGSTFAPVREPLRLVLAILFAFSVLTWYFQPSERPEPFKTLDAATHHRPHHR